MSFFDRHRPRDDHDADNFSSNRKTSVAVYSLTPIRDEIDLLPSLKPPPIKPMPAMALA